MKHRAETRRTTVVRIMSSGALAAWRAVLRVEQVADRVPDRVLYGTTILSVILLGGMISWIIAADNDRTAPLPAWQYVSGSGEYCNGIGGDC